MRSFASMAHSGLPLIVVCGATGTGKSRLAIDIARIFQGEVINADAMQLYEGLEIATNKVTPDEAAGISHHLLGVFPASLAGRIDVRDYRDRCLSIIEKIQTENNHIPVLAGGTHYYLESVLWSDFLGQTNTKQQNIELTARVSLPTDPAECYAQLKRLNPFVAAQIHPNDVRKAKRALTETLTRQFTNELIDATKPSNVSHDGPPNRSYHPRYPDRTLIFWTDCDGSVLDTRLDQRVDAMVQSGLIDELDRFLTHFPVINNEEEKARLPESDKIEKLFGDEAKIKTDPFVRRGILQSIGFKEFAEYLSLPASSSERTSSHGQKLLGAAIDQVKLATRQYARRQVRWITNRFLRRPARGGLPIYRIPVTDVLRSENPIDSAHWDRLVLAPVARVIYDYLLRFKMSIVLDHVLRERLNTLLDLCPADQAPQPCPFVSIKDTVSEDHENGPPYICSACSSRVFFRSQDWNAHIRSRSHQKRTNKLRKRAILESLKHDDG